LLSLRQQRVTIVIEAALLQRLIVRRVLRSRAVAADAARGRRVRSGWLIHAVRQPQSIDSQHWCNAQ